MCLSTVYQNKKSADSILMKNVQHISCTDGTVCLTDLMGRKMEIAGVLASADLVGGIVIVRVAD